MLTTISAPANTEYRSEYCAEIGAQDIYVTVKRYADDGSYNGGQIWVTVEEYIYNDGFPGLGGFSKFLFNCHISEAANDMEAIRECFHDIRGRLKGAVRNWNQYREWARMEKGGKRAYYTRCANEYKARIPQAAANWKLCKQIWKEITKL